MKKWFLGMCISVLVCGGTVVSASALEIVLAISASPGSMQYVTAEEFTRRANELLGDKAQIQGECTMCDKLCAMKVFS